jgi:hypothetical protein
MVVGSFLGLILRRRNYLLFPSQDKRVMIMKEAQSFIQESFELLLR